MVGAICLPISLFWFGWTAREGIHWIGKESKSARIRYLLTAVIVPIIGSALFSVGVFGLFQAGLKLALFFSVLIFFVNDFNSYLQDCYPLYVASVLASNDLFRSLVGAGFPLFSNGS
jgi:MFS transporter, DHA1 family, multidrug resistance protein